MALQKGDISGIRQVETTGVDPNRGVIAIVRIFYILRKTSSFTLDLPKDGYTAAKAIEAITRDAAERLAVIDAFE